MHSSDCFTRSSSLVELKEAERLHQEQSLAQRQVSAINLHAG